jgi:hypothetical protein
MTKHRPGSVPDALGEMVVSHHASNVQLLNSDLTEAVDQSSGGLMTEVMPAIGDAFMHSTLCLLCLPMLSRTFLRAFLASLGFRQGLFISLEEARVLDECPVRERSKHLDANVNADALLALRQGSVLDLAGEADIPLLPGAPDSAGLDFALNGSMEDGFDITDPGQMDKALSNGEAFLRIGQAVIALTFPSGIARFLACFDTPEEGVEGPLDTLGNVL